MKKMESLGVYTFIKCASSKFQKEFTQIHIRNLQIN